MSEVFRSALEVVDDAQLLNISAFRAVVSQAVVALDVQADDPESFRGSLAASVSDEIHFFDIRTDDHAVHRTQAHIARATHGHMKFSLISAGNGFIVQDGRETVLSTGSMAIYDTDRPYSLFLNDDARMSCIMFPKEILGIPGDMLRSVTATQLGSAGGVGPVLRAYVKSLEDNATDMNARSLRRMFRNAVDMIGTLLDGSIDEMMKSTTRESTLLRILDYIEEHLSDSTLNSTQIAAAHFMSVRQLQGLFSSQGTTVSNVLRARRLERCYDELLNPHYADRTVASIALSNGFVDAAHFNRTFRKRFGVPPGELRAQGPSAS